MLLLIKCIVFKLNLEPNIFFSWLIKWTNKSNVRFYFEFIARFQRWEQIFLDQFVLISLSNNVTSEIEQTFILSKDVSDVSEVLSVFCL